MLPDDMPELVLSMRCMSTKNKCVITFAGIVVAMHSVSLYVKCSICMVGVPNGLVAANRYR